MKRALIFLAVFVFAFVSFAKFVLVETPTEFPEGTQAFSRFIHRNIHYPVEAIENGEEGRVLLQFIVEKTGEVTNVQIIESVSPLLDKEAVRVIESMPNWIPGQRSGGARVRTKFTLPIEFRLPGIVLAHCGLMESVIIDDNIIEESEEGFVGFISYQVHPKFPDGTDALLKFLSENIQYPVEAQENKEEGRVVLHFWIEADGSIGDIEVRRSVSPSLDAEAIRVIRLMPNWIPGQQRGENVRVMISLPITFRLND